jgi:hypothetical protein
MYQWRYLSGGRHDERGVFARWVRWVRMMEAMDEKGLWIGRRGRGLSGKVCVKVVGFTVGIVWIVLLFYNLMFSLLGSFH